MATSSQSSVEPSSNEVKDYICNACEDQNNAETSADFYCKQCERFYCGNCIDPHGKALAKHTTFGRVEIDKWPVSKKVVDFLHTNVMFIRNIKLTNSAPAQTAVLPSVCI
ncbi:hypothetical protein DPMN_005776 [Dreissena polymorpha]|uniref:B box-type domain-containing protein n=1 Tax=Dreissena polymorpha TaxID=45954 RepID=A0A9D4RUU7_DREPO|nr:hypothetical protein DPMN_005776 [Dreissena polymorpha]